MSIDIQDLVDSPLDCPFFDFHPLLPRLAFSAALTVRKFSGGTMENAGLAPAVSDAPTLSPIWLMVAVLPLGETPRSPSAARRAPALAQAQNANAS